MKVSELQKKLIAAARSNPPSDAVPYAFEKRITARLSEMRAPVADALGDWAAALWRAAVPCLAVMVVFGAWTFLSAEFRPAAGDLAQDLDNTVLAAADQDSAVDTIE